jgi:hypothetical protein
MIEMNKQLTHECMIRQSPMEVLVKVKLVTVAMLEFEIHPHSYIPSA